MAHLLHSGHHGRHRAGDVARHLRRLAALFGDRGRLCRVIEALPGAGQLVLFRRTGLPQSRQGVALCPALEVHRGLGVAPLLLDLPRGHGCRDGDHHRLHRGDALAEFHERLQSGSGVHDGRWHCLLFWGGLHRLSRRDGLDGGQHRHQRHSDLRLAGVLCPGPRIPHEPSAGKRRLAVRFHFGGGLHLRVCDAKDGRQRTDNREHCA